MTRRADVAQRLLERAAANHRYVDARRRWAPGRLHWRAFTHTAAGAVEAFAASALGYRAADPAGLELPAGLVLHGAQVTQCETGHEWPATVRACVEASVRSVRVPTWHDVCGDCALALLDAGVMYGGYGKDEK